MSRQACNWFKKIKDFRFLIPFVQLILILGAVPAHAATVSGTVFEDVNYGGGAGRNWATASGNSGAARSAARVELFDGAGAFVTSTTTDGSGNYSFGSLAAGNFTVRVVSSSVTSSRTGYVAGLLPVQTYRTSASSGTAVDVTDYVGGHNPATADAGDAAAGWVLNNATGVFSGSGSGEAHAFAQVTVSAANVTGMNFGFNFETIVNTNDSGQGSLRQFILNSNALGGEGSLAQSGFRKNSAGANQALPAGIETGIFIISDGQAHPGLRAGLANLLSASGIAVITPAIALPAITGDSTALDGSTQTVNVGNTNAVMLGAGGTVGVDGLTLSQVAGPEVEIRGTASLATGIEIQANNAVVRGLAIEGFGSTAGNAGILVDLNMLGTLIENNAIGSTAASFSDPGAALRNWMDIYVNGGRNGLIRNNLIGFGSISGIQLTAAATGWSITGNEIRDNGLTTTNGDGIAIDSSSTATTTGNLITGSSSQGYVVGTTSGNVFTNNTTTGCGVGISSGFIQSSAITIRTGTTSTLIDRNVIRQNYGAGIQINDGASGIRLTKNSFSNNGTITAKNGSGPTGQIGIDLNAPGDNIDLGTSPFVTLNDSGDTDTGGNGLVNYPVLTTATLIGGNLALDGYARPGSVIELFVAAPHPSGFGEGQTWKLTLTEGGTGAGGNDSYADTDAGTGTYGPGAINGISQGTDTTNKFRFTFPVPSGVSAGTRLTATATDASNNTSEFGANITVGMSISGTVFEDVNYGGGSGRNWTTASGNGGSVRSTARVELFDGAGAFVTSTTTDGSGHYMFSSVAAGNYTVRVVSSSVTSSRTGYVAGLLPVQTYRTNASTGTAVDVSDFVGGHDPATADAGNSASGWNLNNSTGVFSGSGSGKAHAFAPLTVSGAGVTGVDFGFNFDTIVNINDTGQGSLRQFILNANILGNAGLAQTGLGAGMETGIFMITDGNAHPGLRSGLPNQLTGGVAVIQTATPLPAVSDANTIIDGSTQTTNVGDTNLNGLEVELSGAGVTGSGLSVSGASAVTFRGLAIHGFAGSGANGNGIYLNNAANTLIHGCYLGTNASGTAALANSAAGIAVAGTSSAATIGGLNSGEGNLIAYNGTNGISLGSSGAGTTVRGNTLRNNTQSGVYDTTPGVIIARNLIRNNGGAYDGIWLDTGGANTKIYHNTIHANGRDGIRIGDTGAIIRNNILTGNSGYGINRIAAAMTESYNDVTDAATSPANTAGRGSVSLDATDLNVNPLYINSATGNFSLTECTSPAINNGIDLGADQPDMNGAAAGLWNNNAPDMGAFESGSSCAPNLAIVKQAWNLNGSAPLTTLTAPVGSTIAFLIYVKNTTSGSVTDLRINDSLDETAFQYLAGSMLRTSAATPPSDTATDLAIFTATASGTGTPLTDGVDGDVASALNTGGLPDIDRITIGAVAGQANASLALGAHSIFGLRFNVKIK